MDENYFEAENKQTRKNFNLEEILEFQKNHDVQIVRGEDWLYQCYIDKSVYISSLTPMNALVFGIQNYKSQINLDINRTPPRIKPENMTRFKLVKVPTEATDFFINNIGCLRYSYNEGKESTAIEPTEMEIYLERNKHTIVGETFLNEQRYVVIEMTEW